jgi:hypothetical protein
MKIAKVSHSKLTVQPTKKLLRKSHGGCSDYDVVDVDEQLGRVRPRVKHEHRRFRHRGDKAHSGDVGGKSLVPRVRSPLQTIEGLVQTTDMIRMSLVNKTRGLLAIHHFLKIALEKDTGAGEGNLKNKADGGMLDNRVEWLIIVNCRALRIAPDNPSSLAASQSAIRVEFVAKNPLAHDHVSTRLMRHQSPGAIVQKSLMFLCHGCQLERILKSLARRWRSDIKRCRNSRQVEAVQTVKNSAEASGPGSHHGGGGVSA